jgi:integrase
MSQKKYQHLLEDNDIRRWYENRRRGSPVTADVSLRRLGAFCDENSITPARLLEMDEKELFDFLLDFVSSSEKKGLAGSYISSIIKAIRSWLSYNHKEIRGKIKIRGQEDTPSLKNEKVPSQDELKRILLSGDKKTRVACILMAHAGVRPEVIGNYYGNDGLRVGDLPELEVKEGKIMFAKTPTMIIVRSELSKAKNQYITFLSEEGCNYLKDYLEERMLEGENITPESPLITPKLKMKPFIRTVNIGDTIRLAIRSAGFPCRPYVLRSFFDTQLMMAESKGHVIRDHRTFWMGHRGDIENRYTTNRKRLPEDVIENMRESYRKSQPYLQTDKAVGKEDIDRKIQRAVLMISGFKEEEIEDLHPSDMTEDELFELARKKLTETSLNQNKQKVVPVDNVAQHIEQGWEFVAELSNHKAVIRLPN